jgi:hypothetical protein
MPTTARNPDLFLLSLGTEFCPPRGHAPARSHILQGPVLFGTPITIRDDSGQITPIEHSSAHHAYKTLGTFQAATKRQTIQYQMLKKKATTLFRNLALSTCSANAVWLYYSSIFMKGIGYPLSVSSLSKTQLKQLQAPITALTLNCLRYPKSLSRTVVFGSSLYGGLEFALLDTTQGAGKIQLLLQHFRTPGQPHDIARVVVDRFQYNAGVRFHILEDTKRELPHLEGKWITTVRAYLATLNGSLQIAEAKIQTLQRHGDQYIMDVVLASRFFKPQEIKFINYCRLYLQVLSLSGMYNAQGNALAVGIYDGYRSASQSCSVLLEPLQDQPSKVTWSLWRRFLFLNTADGCWVCEPLGPWYNGLSTRCRWPNYFAPSCDMLSRYVCKELVIYQRLGPNDFSERRTTYAIQHLPADAIPVDVTDIDVGWYMFDTVLPAPLEMNLVAFPTFAEYLQCQPEHESLLLQRFKLFAEDIFALCEQIRVLSKIILVSDGGAIDDYGLYGWVVSTQEGIKIAHRVPEVCLGATHDPTGLKDMVPRLVCCF